MNEDKKRSEIEKRVKEGRIELGKIARKYKVSIDYIYQISRELKKSVPASEAFLKLNSEYSAAVAEERKQGQEELKRLEYMRKGKEVNMTDYRPLKKYLAIAAMGVLCLATTGLVYKMLKLDKNFLQPKKKIEKIVPDSIDTIVEHADSAKEEKEAVAYEKPKETKLSPEDAWKKYKSTGEISYVKEHKDEISYKKVSNHYARLVTSGPRNWKKAKQLEGLYGRIKISDSNIRKLIEDYWLDERLYTDVLAKKDCSRKRLSRAGLHETYIDHVVEKMRIR